MMPKVDRLQELDRLIAAEPETEPEYRNTAGETVKFTPREMGILAALVSGYESNRALGSHLLISAGTARVYICRLHRKLRLENRTAVALWAERNLNQREERPD